jgi:hypothetical protein
VEPPAFKKYEFTKHWFGFSYNWSGVRPDVVNGAQLVVNGKQQGRFLALP